MAGAGYAIGVDLGGTKIEYALVDEKGRIEAQMRHPTDVKGGTAAVEKQIAQGVRELQSRADSPVAGIGIGVAGQIEKDSGIVHMAPNLDWHDEPLKENLDQMLDLPVTVTNDVRAAAWGEWLHGAGRGCEDLLCVFVGTGVGGAVVSGGRMLTGSSNTFGEIGHIPVDLHGPVCHCGNRGCLETLAGGRSIADRARKIAAARSRSGARLLALADGDP